MKMLEHVEEGLIRQRVEIDEMQCGFMLGCSTTDAMFMVHQLQEKHLIANKPLYMAFVYLEKKAFDSVHQDFIWLAKPTPGTEEWLVHLVKSMYKNVRSRVRVGDITDTASNLVFELLSIKALSLAHFSSSLC